MFVSCIFFILKQRKDLLELMLESEVLDANGKKIPKLTDKEIVAQSMTFMLAGYETTSNAYAILVYNMLNYIAGGGGGGRGGGGGKRQWESISSSAAAAPHALHS